MSFEPRLISFPDSDNLRIIIDDLLAQEEIRYSNLSYASSIVLHSEKEIWSNSFVR